MSKCGVFSGLCFPVFGLNTGKMDQKKLHIWTFFTEGLFSILKDNRMLSSHYDPLREYVRFSEIWTDYGEIQSISSYSVRIRENMDQKKSEYGQFLRSDPYRKIIFENTGCCNAWRKVFRNFNKILHFCITSNSSYITSEVLYLDVITWVLF